MKVRKGVFGAVLILCATLCMTNVTALADDGTHTHPICGTTHTDIGDHTGECADVVWTAWDGTSDIDYGDDNTAYVYLSGTKRTIRCQRWKNALSLSERIQHHENH